MAVNTQFQALDIETNYLSQYFLQHVRNADCHFDRTSFLIKFEQLEYYEQVDLVYQNLLQHTLFPNFATDAKNDILARTYKEKGDLQFGENNFDTAVDEYSNCLAMAKSKEILALTYGKRSECFYALSMRKECLEDISRALKLDYPEELKEALLEVQQRAQEVEDPVQTYCEKISDILEFEKNPKIQCASNSIEIDTTPYGTFIVATRDIDIGEMIAVENPYTGVVFHNHKTKYCHQCLKLCYNPIPCEKCTQALFCSEECKEESKRKYHKYECPILFALNEFTTNNTTLLLALRITFLALNDTFILNTFEFDDHKCYRSDRYNEIHTLKPKFEPEVLDMLHETVLTAFVYQLLWTETSYFNSISSLWANKEDFRNKFKEVMLQQLMSTKYNAVKIYDYTHKLDMYETDNFGFGIYSFFPLFNHSCCANVMKSYHGTTLVLRALNHIKKGQQCFVNRYGLRYDAFPAQVRNHMLTISRLPRCKCVACENNWIPNPGNLPEICNQLGIENMKFDHIIKKFIGTNLDAAREYLPKLTALLKECEQSEPAGNAVMLKRLIAHCYAIFGNKRPL